MLILIFKLSIFSNIFLTIVIKFSKIFQNIRLCSKKPLLKYFSNDFDFSRTYYVYRTTISLSIQQNARSGVPILYAVHNIQRKKDEASKVTSLRNEDELIMHLPFAILIIIISHFPPFF